MFYKKGVPKNFTKFTENYLRWISGWLFLMMDWFETPEKNDKTKYNNVEISNLLHYGLISLVYFPSFNGNNLSLPRPPILIRKHFSEASTGGIL